MIGLLRLKAEVVTPSDDNIVSVPFKDFKSVLQPKLYEHAYCCSVELPDGIHPGENETAESWPRRLIRPESGRTASIASGMWTEKVVIDARRTSEHRGVEIRTAVIFSSTNHQEERQLSLIGIGGRGHGREMDIHTIYLGKDKELVPQQQLVTAAIHVLSAVTSFINLSRRRQGSVDYLRQAARYIDKAFGTMGMQEVHGIRCLRMQLPGIPPARPPRGNLETCAPSRIR